MDSGLMFPKPEKKKRQKVIRKKEKQKRQQTEELMFPKPEKKKKRKKHKKSILQEKDGRCYLCMLLNNDYRIHRVTHEHHIYGGPLRDISEAEGFKVHLCINHHEFAKEAVHENHELLRLLQKICQRKYEETHTRQQFMELIGRNYLEAEENERV